MRERPMSRQKLEGPRCENENCGQHESEGAPLTETGVDGRRYCDYHCRRAQETRERGDWD